MKRWTTLRPATGRRKTFRRCKRVRAGAGRRVTLAPPYRTSALDTLP